MKSQGLQQSNFISDSADSDRVFSLCLPLRLARFVQQKKLRPFQPEMCSHSPRTSAAAPRDAWAASGHDASRNDASWHDAAGKTGMFLLGGGRDAYWFDFGVLGILVALAWGVSTSSLESTHFPLRRKSANDRKSHGHF